MYNWLRNQRLKRPKNDSAMLQMVNEQFMKSSYAQASVEFILLDRAQQFNVLEEFVEHCRKRGYMKTETDKKIMDSVIRKSKHLKSDPDFYKRKEMEKQKEIAMQNIFTNKLDDKDWKALKEGFFKTI